MQINTGIINENQGELDGGVAVLEKLNGYIHTVTPVHGDCGAVKVLEKSQNLRCQEVHEDDRFTKLVPVPQEFHFRVHDHDGSILMYLKYYNTVLE